MMQNETLNTLGPIILFGLGETLPASDLAYNFIAWNITNPLEISFLKIPAVFFNISEIIAKNVVDFIERRLLNYQPLSRPIPARAKDTDLSLDETLI